MGHQSKLRSSLMLLVSAACALGCSSYVWAVTPPVRAAGSDDARASEVQVKPAETKIASGTTAEAQAGGAENDETDETVSDDASAVEEEAEEVVEDPSAEDEEVDLGSDEVEAEAVEVSAAPDNAVADVLNAEEIARSGADSLDELLAQQAGFTVNDSFSGSSVSYHGLPAKFTTVLIDGQRIAGRTFDEIDFGQLPVNNLERVEIIRGPQAAAYGSDSAGVVVNLVTARGRGNGGSASLGIGSLGYNRQQIVATGGDETGNWLISAERKLRSSYDFNSGFPDTDGDSYRQYDFMAKYNRSFGRDSLGLQFGSFQENSRGQTFSPPDQIRSIETFTRRFSGSASYTFALDGKTNLSLSQNYSSYYHNLDRFFVDFPDSTLLQTGFRDELSDTHLSLQNYGKDYYFSAGIERNADRLESDRIDGAVPGEPGTADAAQLGAYASGEWYLDDKLQLSAALRYDDHDVYGGQLSPKAGLQYRLDPESSFEFSAGAGYRAPSLRERYYLFSSPFGYLVEGNPDLEPEISQAYNASYERQTALGRLHFGLFSHNVENLIVFDEVQAVPQVFRTENVGRARSTGVELAGEKRWITYGCLECGPEYFGLGYDLAWLAEAKDSELGTRLVNSPEFDQRFRAFYEWPDCRAEALLRMQSSRFLNRENSSEAPAFSTLDLSVSKQVSDGRVQLSGLNVLDEKDGRFGPEPGRELRLEYTLNF